jgi:hypothetical protein
MSDGIDLWIQRAPESWAKLAKSATKKNSFEQFKKKFFEGAESENKAYLKDYLNEDQLKTIYEKGLGGTKTTSGATPVKRETRTLSINRKGKSYSRTTSTRWELKTKFVLQLAAKEKPRSQKYYEYLNILMQQGRTRQAAVKKIQRERKKAQGEKQ